MGNIVYLGLPLSFVAWYMCNLRWLQNLLKLSLLVLCSRVGCLSQDGAWHHSLNNALRLEGAGSYGAGCHACSFAAGTVEAALAAAAVVVVGTTFGGALGEAPGA